MYVYKIYKYKYKVQIWSDVTLTIAGRTNKERQSYSANGPWKADMSKYAWIGGSLIAGVVGVGVEGTEKRQKLLTMDCQK